MDKEKGRVKWFNPSKGFGFIQTSALDDVFVHYKQICGDGYITLKKNQIVSFKRVETNKGPHATNVQIIKN